MVRDCFAAFSLGHCEGQAVGRRRFNGAMPETYIILFCLSMEWAIKNPPLWGGLAIAEVQLWLLGLLADTENSSNLFVVTHDQ